MAKRIYKPKSNLKKTIVLSLIIAQFLLLQTLTIIPYPMNVSLEIDSEQENNINQQKDKISHIETQTASLPNHNPIVINNNLDFVSNSDWAGSGTSQDPYKFEGFYINAIGNSGINISNTNVYFIIQNVWVNGSLNPGIGGIQFNNVSNGELINNTVTQSTYGFYINRSSTINLNNNSAIGNNIGFVFSNSNYNNLVNNKGMSSTAHDYYISYSSNNNFINNTSLLSKDRGMASFSSNFNNFVNNYVYKAKIGLYFSSSSNNNFTNNIVTNCQYNNYWIQNSDSNTYINNFATDGGSSGFHIEGSKFNDFNNNTISNNGGSGFYLKSSLNNSFASNVLSNNVDFGINLLSSNSNYIEKNQFTSNKGGGVQAFDNGSFNIFGFNYWSDWVTPDLDTNLIVDIPYPINGASNNKDYYPLTYYYNFQFIHINSPSNRNYYKLGENLQIQVDLSFNISQVKFNWNKAINTTFFLNNSNKSFNFHSKVPTLSNQQTIEIFAKNSFGKWYSTEIIILIDEGGPIIISNDGNNTRKRSGDFIHFSIFDELTSISQVWFIWDNNGTTFNLTNPYELPLISPEGNHSLKVFANDSLGNIIEERFLFETDNTPPKILLQNLINGSVYQSGTIIGLSILGSDSNLIYSWDLDTNKTVNSSFSPVIPNSEGLHELHLYSRDSAGNWISVKYVFICDNTAPDIILIKPANNAILAPNTQIEFSISDKNGIKKVLFSWDRDENVTLNSPFNILLPSGEGDHSLTVYVRDVAGNWGKLTLAFTTANSQNFLPIFIGIIFLISIAIVIGFYKKNHKNWWDKIEHLIVLTKSGMPLYSFAFQEQELEADTVLAGGALVGISSLTSEITKSSNLKVIKQEDYCIMIEEGSTILLAVLIKEEISSIRKRMKSFISEFESTFENFLSENLNDTDAFEPAKNLIESHFKK